jgi:DNA-binding SARP family transcriptional activator
VFYGVLGTLVLRGADGVDLPLRGTLPRRLLAALLISEGRPVSTDALAEVLWDGAPPSSATGTLHSTISRLRRILEAGGAGALLRFDRAGYRLDAAPDAVDARRFVRLAREGRTLMGSDPAAALARFTEAEGLWRGPALVEFADRDFARSAAGRLNELRIDTHEDAIEAQLALGAGAGLLDELAALTEAHPLRERLRGQHAVALYRSGRQAEALAVVSATRQLLRNDLGLDLSPALQELETRLLRQDAALAPAPRVHAPAGTTTAEPRRTSGRDGELALLRALVTETAAGEVRFGLLEGEPGIGKTRLLEEVASLAASAGARAVWGHCADSPVVPAYWPWVEVLRALHREQVLGTEPAELAVMLEPGAGREQQPSDALRFRLFELVTDALLTAARSAPLVVLLEDLHWADPASAELLHHLSVRLHGVPVAVVASLRELEMGRDDAVCTTVAALVRRAGTRRLVLRPVPASASVALVRDAVGQEVGIEAATAIHRRAQGNPFFIGELSRLLRDVHRLDDAAAVDQLGVPSGVRDVVRRRLAGLPQETRVLIDVAAVVGREADLAVLAQATGLTVDACIDAIEPALASRVFLPVESTPGRLQFAHALVRDAALTEVSSLRTARLHARVADAVLSLYGDNDEVAEVVASHLWVAAAVVGAPRAADALERAAAVAMRRTAYEAADDLLSRALDLRRSAGGGAAAQEAELLTTVRLVSLRRGWRGYRRAYETVPLERAEHLAMRLGRTDLYLGLLFAQWGSAATSGDVGTAHRLGTRIRGHAQGSDDPVVEVLGETVWAITCWHLGRMVEADSCMRWVQERLPQLSERDLTRLEDVDSAASMHAFSIHIRVLAGSLEPDGHFEALTERFPRPYDRLVIGNFAGMTAVLRDDDGQAAHWAEWALQHDHDAQFDFFGGACEIYLGWARARQGEPQAGLELIDHGFTRSARAGGRTGFGFMAAIRAEAMLLAGRPAEAVATYLDESEQAVQQQGERFVLPYLQLARTRLAVAQRTDPAETARHLDAARRAAEEMGIAPVAAIARSLDPGASA